MELFLDLGVLALWPEEFNGSVGTLRTVDDIKGGA